MSSLKSPASGDHLTAADLIRSSSVRSMAMKVSGQDGEDRSGRTLIAGRFSRRILRPGISLHTTDAEEQGNFITSTELPPGLSCIFYLKGDLDISLGSRNFHVGTKAPGKAGSGAIILNRAEPELFTRFSRERQMVRKVVIGLTPAWLDAEDSLGLATSAGISGFFGRHLAAEHVAVTPAMTVALNALLQVDPQDGLRRLREETLTLSLLLAVLSPLHAAPAVRTTQLTAHEELVLRRAQEFLRTHLGEGLTTATIAGAAGCSQSVLQRIIRRATGKSLFTIVREERLVLARRALTEGRVNIAGAATLAGYATAESFSTACLRHFGERPIRWRNGNTQG